MPKTVQFHQWKCYIKASRYRENNRLALMLVDVEDGAPVAMATVNLPDVHLEPGHILIKDYSENAGMLEALIDAGIVRDTGVRHPAGWVQVPEVELLVQPEDL